MTLRLSLTKGSGFFRKILSNEMKVSDFMFSHNTGFYLAAALVGLSVSMGKNRGERELILWIFNSPGKTQIHL